MLFDSPTNQQFPILPNSWYNALSEKYVLLLWRNAPKVVIPRSEATWESPAGSCDFADSFPTVQLGTARLPRRPLASSQ